MNQNNQPQSLSQYGYSNGPSTSLRLPMIGAGSSGLMAGNVNNVVVPPDLSFKGGSLAGFGGGGRGGTSMAQYADMNKGTGFMDKLKGMGGGLAEMLGMKPNKDGSTDYSGLGQSLLGGASLAMNYKGMKDTAAYNDANLAILQQQQSNSQKAFDANFADKEAMARQMV